jgi:hypothetical protein
MDAKGHPPSKSHAQGYVRFKNKNKTFVNSNKQSQVLGTHIQMIAFLIYTYWNHDSFLQHKLTL